MLGRKAFSITQETDGRLWEQGKEAAFSGVLSSRSPSHVFLPLLFSRGPHCISLLSLCPVQTKSPGARDASDKHLGATDPREAVSSRLSTLPPQQDSSWLT